MASPDLTHSSEPVVAVPGISNVVVQHSGLYRDAFLQAWPFKHLAIDAFFESSFAERLLDEFPRFDPELARNEMGKIANKAVNTRIREISPAYRELYDIISGTAFLELMSRISGIPDLILDPKMYGGGTHESRHGQELDPHVDFNYDEAQQLHRRLNVIVYLNKGWRTEWGGAIEIHSNPRDPATNQIRAFDPIFNRCVMFETNEISWHGFPKIDLPEDRRDLSRKSISIYLYTKTRPAEEIAPMHGTFYVQRPLSERFREGLTLTSDDVAELKNQLWRRDIWVEHYQKLELATNRELEDKNRGILAMMQSHHGEIENAKAALAAAAEEQRSLTEALQYRLDEHQRHVQEQQEALQTVAELTRQNRELSARMDALSATLDFLQRNIRIPIVGYAVQAQIVAGVHADLWMEPRAEIEIRPVVLVNGVRLQGWRPEGSPTGVLRLRVAESTAEIPVSGGHFSIEVRLARHTREPFRVVLECDPLSRVGSDTRELGFRLTELRTLHSVFAVLAKT